MHPSTFRVDEIADRFEDDWREGKRPRIDRYLPEHPGQRAAVLRELVLVDLECRLINGEPARAEDYLVRYPELKERQALLEILSLEFRCRRKHGPPIRLDELENRFPGLSHQISPDDNQTPTFPFQDVNDEGTLPLEVLHDPVNIHTVNCPACQSLISFAEGTSSSNLFCSSCDLPMRLSCQGNDSQPVPVTRLAQYELVEPLGSGAVGIVWQARDTRLHRDVAIKIPRKGGLSHGELDHFLREARAAAQLKHPNIVSVHDVGRDAGFVFIVSDLVRGRTLSDAIQRMEDRSFRAQSQLCANLADALHHAHEQGVIHRDLKPSNIMIDSRTQPHIMDFGLAKREIGEATMTVEGRPLGTPAFMSPEQANGRAHWVDRRTDVYSLGVILYQLLTGELPFQGNREMLLYKVIHHPPPRPRRLNPDIPADLQTITLRCLEKEPQQRYSTALDVAQELRRFLSGQPIEARPLSKACRTYRWCKRNPVVATLSGASTALLILVAVIAVIGYLRTANALAIAKVRKDRAIYAEELAQQATIRESEARRTAELARSETEKTNRQLQSTLADTEAAMGFLAHRDGRPDVAALWFAHAASVCPTDSSRQRHNRIRANAWSDSMHMPVRVMQIERQTIKDQPGNVGLASHVRPFVKFDATGRYLLITADDLSCRIWDLKTDSIIECPGNHARVRRALLNYRGDRLVLALAHHIEVYDFPSCNFINRISIAESGSKAIVSEAVISSSGLLAISTSSLVEDADMQHRVHLWDLDAERFLATQFEHPVPVIAMSFSRSGSHLATATRDHQARVFAIGRDTDVPKPQVHSNDAIRDKAFPVRAAGFSGTRSLTATGLKIEPCFPPVTHYVGPGIAPTFVDDDGGILTLSHSDLVTWRDTKNGSVKWESSYRFGVKSIEASDDGRYATVLGFKTALLFDFANDHPPVRYGKFQNNAYGAAFAPDSSAIVTVGSEHAASLWSLPGGTAIGAPLAHSAEPADVTFSPTGRHFATSQKDGLIKVWSYDRSPPSSHVHLDGRHSYFCVSPDLNRFALSGSHLDSGIVGARVFRTLDSRAEGASTPVGGLLLNSAFSPDGAQLVTLSATGVYSDNSRSPLTDDHKSAGCIEFWNWQTGDRMLPPIDTPSLPIGCLFDESGARLFVLCARGEILAVTTKDGTTVEFEIPAQPIEPFMLKMPLRPTWMALTSDGRILITSGHAHSVQVIDIQTGRLLFDPLPHEQPCFDIAISKDQKLLATASRDHQARVWDLTSGELLSRMKHSSWVFRVAFDGRGRRLLTGCLDKAARVWNWRDQRLTCPPLEHDDEVFCSEFVGDSDELIITTSRDRRVHIWEANADGQTGPPVKLRVVRLGVIPYQTHVQSAPMRVIASGIQPKIEIVDLESFQSRDDVEMDLERLVMREEIRSCSHFHPLGGTAALPTREWLKRWYEWQRADRISRHASESEPSGWHRRQYAIASGASNWQTAAWHLSRLIAHDPLDGYLFNQRGIAFSLLGDTERATNDFDRAAKLGVHELRASRKHQLALLDEERWEDLLQVTTQDLERWPLDWKTYYCRCLSNIYLQDLVSAERDINRVIELGANIKDVWKLYVLLALASDDSSHYSQACGTIVHRFGGTRHPIAAELLAWTCGVGANVDPAAALDAVDVAIGNEPHELHHRNSLGWLQIRAGEPQNALTTFAQVVSHFRQQTPTFEHIRGCLGLAVARFHRGDWAGGHAVLSVAKRLWRSNHHDRDEAKVASSALTKLEITLLMAEADSLESQQTISDSASN